MPYADLTDVRCHYEVMGNGDPLLMISGLGSTIDNWNCVASQLAQSFTLILIDNRETGQSVAKRTPQVISDLASDVVELLDHLQLDRAHVLGLSFGGIIAQRFAIDHPSRVDRLVLMSCASRFGPYVTAITTLLAHTLRRFPIDQYRKIMDLLGTSPEYFDAHADQIAQMADGLADSCDHRAAAVRQLACLGSTGVAPPDEYRIDAPTLVIAGEQDLLVPQAYVRRMADEIPGSEFFSIPSCGHNPLQEKPDVVIPRIVEFLSRSSTASAHPLRQCGDSTPVMEEAF